MKEPEFMTGPPDAVAALIPSVPAPDKISLLRRLDCAGEELQLLRLLVDDPEVVMQMRQLPKSLWFTSPGRQRVLLAWRDLFNQQMPVTRDAVHRKMMEQSRPDEFELVEEALLAVLRVQVSDAPENLARALREAAKCRRFSALINQSNVGLQRNESIEVLWERAMLVLAEDEEHEAFQPFQEALDETLQQVLYPDPTKLGLLTGLHQFDALTGGLKAEKNIVIAGMQGMGKTAMYLELESRVLFKYPDAAVLVLSLEMSQEALQKRKLANLSYVDVNRQEGHAQPGQVPLSNAEHERLVAARERMREWDDRIEIHYRPMGPEEMMSTMRKFAMKHKDRRKIVVCDHLGMVRRGKNKDDVRVGIMNAVQVIKDATTEYGYTGIHLAQMVKELENKAKHGSNHHKPDASLIAESGFINQVADAVFCLWRPEIYTKEIMQADGESFETAGKLFLVNGKMRDGSRQQDPLLGCNMRFYQIYNLEDAPRYHLGMQGFNLAR